MKGLQEFFKSYYKHITICIVIALSITLWIIGGFISFLSTVVIGLLIGLCSSFIISSLFEKERKENREKIRGLVTANFVYACADFLVELEQWYINTSSDDKYSIIENPSIMLDKLQNLSADYKETLARDVPAELSALVFDYNYSIAPIYGAYKQLDNQQLLLTDVLDVEEYRYFHNLIRRDMFDDYFKHGKNQIFVDNVSGYYTFHQLRICMNCVLDAVKIFPEITEKYAQIKQRETFKTTSSSNASNVHK